LGSDRWLGEKRQETLSSVSGENEFPLTVRPLHTALAWEQQRSADNTREVWELAAFLRVRDLVQLNPIP